MNYKEWSKKLFEKLKTNIVDLILVVISGTNFRVMNKDNILIQILKHFFIQFKVSNSVPIVTHCDFRLPN